VHVIDLGTLAGAERSVGLALGPDREVVGWGLDASGRSRAVRWVGGRIQDLGVPRLGDALALDVNAEGAIVGVYGESDDPATMRAFVWRAGRVTTLPGLRGAAGATARRISDSGLIVGSAFDAGGREHAVMWVYGRPVDVGIPPGFSGAYAMDVTDDGVVVGGAYTDEVNVAFRWRLGRFRVLATLGGSIAQASVIGLRRDIGGFSQTAAGAFEATVWDGGGRPRGIGFLGGGDDSEIFGTDGVGGYVGGANLVPGGPPEHVFVERDGGPLMTLPALNGDPLGRSGAHGLDADGNVAGSSETGDGLEHATLWTCVWAQALVPARPLVTGRAGAARAGLR
jgi:uncharacterized membrane protein